MSATRLFVGNLPETTNENVLRKAFSAFGEVTNLELKCKSGGDNEKKFAFVSLSGSNYDIETCIKHFSSENFNGNRLYVTRARESFLERLQRERQQTQQKESSKNSVSEPWPKKNPVIKLSDKLNPRKRKNDDKVITDTNSLTFDNIKSFNTNNYTNLPGSSSGNPSLIEKDQKKQDSDNKRLESMKRKRQEFRQKQMIIKSGLVGIDKVQNKKIFFTDGEGSEEIDQVYPPDNNNKSNKKNTLFDDDDESDDELNFEIKKQFEGIQGQKVLDLQSRYKSDKRFVLDERFVDDEKLDETDSIQNIEQEDEIVVSQTDEKVKQLNILQDVLGVAIKSHATQPAEAKDNKKKAKLGMLRFDPSQPEHAKFFAPREETNQETQKKSKKKKTKEKQTEEEHKPEQLEQDVNKVEVSKEQFYKVSDTLKEAIAQPTTFSLRSLFVASEPDEKDVQEQDTNYIPIQSSKEKKVKNPLDRGEKNPFVYDSSDSEDEAETKETEPETKTPAMEPKSVWKENLFFLDLDTRLKEGLDFFNTPVQTEGSKERRELKSVMKKRIYNKERKNQMFQKKIGGRKKTLKKSYRKKSNKES